ncbi:hypothetical protein T08_8512 [Trichinella sp. T8]|nr:hypothetical protein T08_8512 [Trichinella sp. T8]
MERCVKSSNCLTLGARSLPPILAQRVFMRGGGYPLSLCGLCRVHSAPGLFCQEVQEGLKSRFFRQFATLILPPGLDVLWQLGHQLR